MTEPKLSALELRIMGELWSRGACSIREIHEAVVKRDRPAYTTVQTMVYRLEVKGAVRRTKKIGNAHVFEATTSRASVQTRLLKELLGLFGGNARPVMAHLVEMGKISSEDIDEAQKLLRAHTAKEPAKEKGQMISGLINHLWQSTLFCGGAWLITLALRTNSAALRHWVWMLASLKFLVPFSLLFYVGSYIGLPAARVADTQPLMLGDALQSVAVLVSPSALRATEFGAASIALVLLLAVWIGGALLIGTRWLLAWRAADSLVRAARPAPGALPDARITDADIEPAVARVFHPVVLLPAALLGRLSQPEIDAVLAHEREHIERNDNLKDSVHRLVEMLFWFHPAVWWIGRQMLEERERACDEAVLAGGHDGGEYASGILAVCRHCSAGAAVTATATSGNLTQRVRYILGDGRPAALGAVKAVSLMIATIAATTVPMFAGAVDGTAHRLELLALNSRALSTADFFISPASGSAEPRQRIVAARDGVVIRNTSLRDLIALAYGVERWQVNGNGQWLDSLRYDIRAVTRDPVSEPEELDPYALRDLTAKLLATRFDLEIHVNRQCQSPCGRYALTAANTTQ